MLKKTLLVSLNGVVDLLQKMQIQKLAERFSWDDDQANLVNGLVDNVQLIVEALFDDVADKVQFEQLLHLINDTAAEQQWVKPKMIAGGDQDANTLIISVNQVIDLLQLNLVPQLAQKFGWDEDKAKFVNSAIDNLQKFLVAFTDEVANSVQLLRLAHAVNLGVGDGEWLEAQVVEEDQSEDMSADKAPHETDGA